MNYAERKTVVIKKHAKYHLALMLEYEQNHAYYYVDYKGHKIGLIQDTIGKAQSVYRVILKVLDLGL